MGKQSEKTARGGVHTDAWQLILLQREHFEELYAIEKRCYKHPWSRQAFAEALGPMYEGLGVKQRNRPIAGFILYYVAADQIHVVNLAVDPQWQRKGMGEMLLCEANARSREQGATTSCLEVQRSNGAAQRLYEKLGYRQVGSRKNYYLDENDDALLFTLVL